MSLRHIECLIWTIIIILTNNNYVESTCVESKPACTCIRSDGQGYDLSSIQERPIFSDLQNFVFQPCKNVDLTFTNTTKSDCKSSSVCMNNKTESINLGLVEQSAWELLEDNHVHLIFKHDNYITIINLVCCYDCKSSTLTAQTSSLSTYNLILQSRKSCLVMLKPRGLSTGSVLVILFLIFSSLYFIGGAMALKFLRGAVGWELVPNYDFWSDLPALVRDGVTFTLSGCSAVSYERI